ncbi:MAG: acyl-CoA dehydrogenase family protein [Verrucomicrobiales bacterium]|nr:acyl-CoA dehydrogenase family protein [Verrucomicrobiales bacterium]
MKDKNPKWVCDLAKFIDRPHRDVRERVRQILAKKEFQNPPRDSTAEYRDSVWKLLKIIADEGIGKIGIPEEFGGEGDKNAFLAAFETLAEGDLSVLIKFGVQIGLFGGTIQNLGTEFHHKQYLRDAMEAKLPGCFAMTEGDHGSNVAGLETTITYRKENDTFVIHTLHENAGKDYIGNAAVHAKMASVFGQLIVEGKSHGVHCILVPVRDGAGNPLKGIRIEDDGDKMGLNGVDNGRLWFDNVAVPRENLLNRFGGVNETGEYVSDIESESRRFFTMLGTLVGGRVSIGSSSLTAAKRALKIAIDHALERRQFGEEGKQEILLMDYKLHQTRLIPLLAKTFAIHFALRELSERYGKAETETEERIFERDAAALKAYATWHANKTIQTCREACGGAGYISSMGFSDLKGDIDIFTTFEGDNTVLQLLVAKESLKDFARQLKSAGPVTAAIEITMSQLKRYQLSLALLFSRGDISTMTLMDLLKMREQQVLIDTAKRIRHRIKKDGFTPTKAFNEEGPQLVVFAAAHTDMIVYGRFREALSRVNNQKVRSKLESLLELYGLSVIEENKAWFLSSGLLPVWLCNSLPAMIGEKVGKVRRDVDKLVTALNPGSLR